MKKIICILVIAVLMAGSAAYADQHLEMICCFSGATEKTNVSYDLYEQEEQIIAVSTLFPDYAAVIPKGEGCSLSSVNSFLSLTPEMMIDLQNTADSMIITYLESRLSVPENGVYAGELFTDANTRRTAEFPLSDLTGFLQEDTYNHVSGGSASLLSILAGVIGDSLKQREIILSVQSFNQEQFLSCSITEQNQVIMTVSIDRSQRNERRILIGYREDGLYCYRDVDIKNEQNHIDVRSAFRTGSASSYQRAAEEEPLFTEETILTGEKDEPIAFQYMLSSGVLSSPMYISGTFAGQENQASLNATVRINGPEKEESISVSLILEPLSRPVSVSDKKTIDMTDEKENAIIPLTAASNAALLAAEILPAFPENYQKLIMKLIYP